MIDIIVDHIKTRIAQHTHLFSVSVKGVVAVTSKNIISIDGLEGKYTLSGAKAGIASAGCMNDTHLFVNGKVATECFFGAKEVSSKVKASKVNVGYAFKREVALEAIMDVKAGNSIIVYTGSARSLDNKDKSSESEDMTLKVGYTVGVMFKINAKQMKELGCTNYDKLFISSVIGAKKEGTTMVKFVSVVDRFYAGDSYVVDIEFSYIDQMFMEDSFLEGLKHFDATLSGLNILMPHQVVNI